MTAASDVTLGNTVDWQFAATVGGAAGPPRSAVQ
ncbi:hypothetical protein YM3MPS_03490 [Mycobacterium pseudoshottsii]|nr:hypothetical protein DL240490_03821 [Mycobacterium marinum]BEH74546.1 hypothetical protein YM3MPS_03490 [Mycobacterium pseudoshottsii]